MTDFEFKLGMIVLMIAVISLLIVANTEKDYNNEWNFAPTSAALGTIMMLLGGIVYFGFFY